MLEQSLCTLDAVGQVARVAVGKHATAFSCHHWHATLFASLAARHAVRSSLRSCFAICVCDVALCEKHAKARRFPQPDNVAWRVLLERRLVYASLDAQTRICRDEHCHLYVNNDLVAA